MSDDAFYVIVGVTIGKIKRSGNIFGNHNGAGLGKTATLVRVEHKIAGVVRSIPGGTPQSEAMGVVAEQRGNR
jgi:hypothetical protein